MSASQRRRWSAEERLLILEEARRSDQTVSAICRHYQLAPGHFYAWEKQAHPGALEALRNSQRGRHRADPSQRLHAKIERLRAVVTELSARTLRAEPQGKACN